MTCQIHARQTPTGRFGFVGQHRDYAKADRRAIALAERGLDCVIIEPYAGAYIASVMAEPESCYGHN